MTKNNDMTQVPIFPQLIAFALPLMLSSIIQLLFNAADTVVVGRFAGLESLSAVGACGPLTTLITNLFVGISAGTGSVIARYYGARDDKSVNQCVHTAVLLAISGGVVLTLVCFFCAEPFLRWTDCPENVLPKALVYLRIIAFSMPALLTYNFGASILRAFGDTRRPLFFLSFSGVVNIVLNLILVILFRMDVAGVAIATAVSQFISAVLVLRCLIRAEDCFRLNLKKLAFHKKPLLDCLRLGLPAGLQSSVFSLSNVLVQSTVNSFDYVVVAGNTAATSILSFAYTTMDAVQHTANTFCSCNYGAGKYERMRQIFRRCLLLTLGFGVGAAGLVHLLSPYLLSIYTNDAAAIAYGQIKTLVFLTYFLCGVMNVQVAYLRSMGNSLVPMFNSIFFSCFVRVLWLWTVFAWLRPVVPEFWALVVMYACFPVTWFLAIVAHFVTTLIVGRKLKRA